MNVFQPQTDPSEVKVNSVKGDYLEFIKDQCLIAGLPALIIYAYSHTF